MKSLQCAEARMLPDATSLDERLLSGELAEKVDETLGTLSPLEADVLRLRFGMTDGVEHSLANVGQMLAERSPERIRQIEAKALRKLRHPSRSRELRVFLDGASREYL